MHVSRRLLAGGIAAASMLRGRAGRAADAAEEVRLAVSSTSFVLAGVLLGDKAGLFARNGVALRVTVMDSGNAAMAALLSASVPFASAGVPETLAARARGQDVVVVANLYAGFAGSVVLGKPVVERLGLGPAAAVGARLRALDGLTLAVPSATSVLLAPVRESAAGAGAKVRFTYIAQGAMAAALETGAIAGMVASYPFAGTPILRGTGVLWLNGPGGDFPEPLTPASSIALQTTGAYLRAKPDTVAKLQRSIAAVAEFVEVDKDGARRALAAAYPQLGAQEVDFAFEQQWRTWTKPVLTADDMRKEQRLLLSSVRTPALEQLDPVSALAGPPR